MSARIIAFPAAPAPRAVPGIAGLWGTVAAMLEAHRTRRALLEMDAHHLADIGLSRGDALTEAGRPCWDLATRPRQ